MTLKYGATINVSGKAAVLSDADRDRLAADQPGFGTSSKMEAAFNLVNSTVGAGIIGLPFAIYLAGFWRAIILSTLVAILTGFGCYILIVSGQRVGIYKYAVLMEYTLGRFGYHFLNFLILIQSSGACVSYFIRKFNYLTCHIFIIDLKLISKKNIH
jgi:sodium-coupled neutral amino acid transporter 11